MKISLTPYGLDALERGFRQAPAVARRELLAAMREATLLLEADVVGRYSEPGPKGAKHTGATRASIASDAFATPAGVLGVVGSASPVAAFIELGTRGAPRGWPPLEPLLQWVHDVLGLGGEEAEGAARGIQRKIHARGTPARPFFAQALEKNEAAVGRMFEDAAGRIAAQLTGGAA